MAGKMKFGIDTEEEVVEKKTDQIEIKEVVSEHIETSTDKMKFGAFSDHSNLISEEEVTTNNKNFGVDFNETIEEEKNKTINTVLRGLIQQQDAAFWIKSYIIAIIYFIFFKDNSLLISKFAIINTLFFPFAVIFFGNLAHTISKKKNNLFHLLYPDFKTGTFVTGVITTAIWFLIKFILFGYIWRFALIIGGISLVTMLLEDRK